MSIEERPLSPVLQTELDALLRSGLHTIGFGSASETLNADLIHEKLTGFLDEFEKAKSQFSERQTEALLAQLGPVLAQLFIEYFGWRWACAADELGHDFYFVVSKDKKLMLQPWTFLQEFAGKEKPGFAVTQALAVPALAAESEEVQQTELLYQDIGLAMVAMSSLGEFNSDLFEGRD